MSILQLSLTDFRQILREQLLWVMFIFAPVIQFTLARWLIPVLMEQFPILNGYQFLILGAMCLQVVSGIGFVIAMMILDEKDDGILTAIRVLPLSSAAFLAYRLLAATLVALVFAFGMCWGSGLIDLSVWQAGVAAILFALTSPAVTLFMSTFGDNKVEGLAMYKGVNLVLLLPIASFFTPAIWSYTFGWIPAFWSFRIIADLDTQSTITWFYFATGIILHSLLIAWLFIRFRRKIFV